MKALTDDPIGDALQRFGFYLGYNFWGVFLVVGIITMVLLVLVARKNRRKRTLH